MFAECKEFLNVWTPMNGSSSDRRVSGLPAVLCTTLLDGEAILRTRFSDPLMTDELCLAHVFGPKECYFARAFCEI